MRLRSSSSRTRNLATAAGSLAALVLAGCGPHPANGGPPPFCDAGPCAVDAPIGPRDSLPWPSDTLPPPHVLTAIQIMPVNPIDFVDCGKAATQAFTALGIYADGKNADVTAMATWTTSKASLGGFPSGVGMSTFTSTVPSVADYTTITAAIGTLKGTTVLTLVPRNCGSTGMPVDFFFIAPYNAAPTPTSAVLTFGTNIQQADVGFILDVSGSEQSKISNLQSSLSSLASTLQTRIPSVAMGVAEFSSWPCGSDGSSGDYPWKLDNRIITVATSTGLSQIQSVLGGLTAGGSHIGGDSSEPDFDALYFAASGTGQADCDGGSIVAFDAATAPGAVSGESTGTLGGMGFRTGSLPVLVLVTDAELHDADDPADTTFNPPGSMAHGHNMTLAALKAAGARMVGIASTGGGMDFSPIFTGDTVSYNNWEPHPQEVWLAEQTGTVVPVAAFGGACGVGQCCTGLSGAGEAPDTSGNCPLVYRVDSTGSGLGSSIADAISKLVTFGVMNVGTKVTGKTTDEACPPHTLPSGHTTADFLTPISMLKGVVPASSTPAVGAPGGPTAIDMATEQFLGVQPGTTVRFTVKVYNDFIMLQSYPQIFKANIQVLGNGTTFLDNRNVWILVPPVAPIG